MRLVGGQFRAQLVDGARRAPTVTPMPAATRSSVSIQFRVCRTEIWHWLAAMERRLTGLGVVTPAEIAARIKALTKRKHGTRSRKRIDWRPRPRPYICEVPELPAFAVSQGVRANEQEPPGVNARGAGRGARPRAKSFPKCRAPLGRVAAARQEDLDRWRHDTD